MRRTRLLTSLLWTSVSAVVACGDDGATIVDAGVDAPPDAYVGPLAQFASALALTAECGVAVPPVVELMVTNAGNQPLEITGVSVNGGFAVTTAFPVEIAPGAAAALAVRPPAAVIGTDVGGAMKQGTLALQTNQPGTIGTVALTATVRGANLALVDGGGQALASVDLSSSTGTCPVPAAVFVRNTGNAGAMLFASVGSGGPFAVGGFAPSASVAGGASISHDVSVSATGACSGTGTVEYTVTGSVCTATPLSLPVTYNISGSSTCFCS